MKIVAISDTHQKRPDLPKGDLLVVAGDFCNYGHRTEVISFASYLDEHIHKFRLGSIIVPGNHDLFMESSLPEAKEYLAKHRILIDNQVEIEGLKIYGTPWVPYINGRWAFEENYNSNRFEMARERIPEGLDILISHSPPQGILSLGWGCAYLKERLHEMENPPKIVICGHIHECGGQSHIDTKGITYYNVAICDESYQMVHKPTLIEVH